MHNSKGQGKKKKTYIQDVNHLVGNCSNPHHTTDKTCKTSHQTPRLSRPVLAVQEDRDGGDETDDGGSEHHPFEVALIVLVVSATSLFNESDEIG